MVSRLEELRREAENEPSSALGEAWGAFAADLEVDMAAHEREVMARAHRGQAQREHARRVTQEHAAARTLVLEIGRQIARRQPRAASFDLLAEILRGRVPPDPGHHPGDDPLS